MEKNSWLEAVGPSIYFITNWVPQYIIEDNFKYLADWRICSKCLGMYLTPSCSSFLRCDKCRGKKMDELALYTTEQLIEELVNRTTFAGIIIKATNEIKSSDTTIPSWEMFVRNLSVHDTKDVLSFIGENLSEQEI